jgi:hypothetical protein
MKGINASIKELQDIRRRNMKLYAMRRLTDLQYDELQQSIDRAIEVHKKLESTIDDRKGGENNGTCENNNPGAVGNTG